MGHVINKHARQTEKQWEISERDLYFIIIKVIIKDIIILLSWFALDTSQEARIQDTWHLRPGLMEIFM
jgi:hypothetical protein